MVPVVSAKRAFLLFGRTVGELRPVILLLKEKDRTEK